jgi:hypothetical protein
MTAVAPGPEHAGGRGEAAGRRTWERAVLVSLAVCLIWCARPASLAGHPLGDLSNGSYTDHPSHMNTGRVFPRVGTALWTQPVAKLFPEMSAEERARLPADLHNDRPEYFRVPGWPADKPLVVGWSHNPRNYPPGNMLLVAPVAAAYHFTGLSFRAANRLIIATYVVLAHLAFLLLVRASRPGDRDGDRDHARLGAAALGVVAFYLYGLYWTLQGFYDLAATVPLMLCAGYLARRRGPEALLCYCLAVFLHFRALFLAPWAVLAAWMVLRDGAAGALRRWRARQWLSLGGSALLAAAALYPFWLLQPAFAHLEYNTPLRSQSANHNAAVVAAFAALVLGCALVFHRARAWLDLAVLAFMTLMIALLHQAYEWHPLVLMAWLGAPVTVREGVPAVRFARVGYLVGATVLVFFYHRL